MIVQSYKINIYSLLRIFILINLPLVLTFLSCWFLYIHSTRHIEWYIFLLPNLITYLVGVLPESIAFFNYLNYSKDIEVIIDLENKLIKLNNYGLCKEYSFSEVRYVIRILSKLPDENKKYKPRYGDFFHYCIMLFSGEEIIITRLMLPNYRVPLIISDNEIENYHAFLGLIFKRGRKILNLL
jgi:hypothetical protein